MKSISESREERLTMLKALRTSEHLNSRYYLNESFNDVKFEFQLQDDITIGNSYRFEKKSLNGHYIVILTIPKEIFAVQILNFELFFVNR